MRLEDGRSERQLIRAPWEGHQRADAMAGSSFGVHNSGGGEQTAPRWSNSALEIRTWL